MTSQRPDRSATGAFQTRSVGLGAVRRTSRRRSATILYSPGLRATGRKRNSCPVPGGVRLDGRVPPEQQVV